MEEAVDLALQMLGQPGFRQIVTANAEMIEAARANAALAQVFCCSDLVLPDGQGVLLAAKFAGYPLKERVAGADFVASLAEAGAARGLRFYLLGSRPGVGQAAGAELQRRYPGLVIAGTQHGYFKPEETEAVVSAIVASRPDVLLTALGSPRQEFFVQSLKNRLSRGVGIGVGGTLDVLAGKAQRAPRWMQKVGLEWFYRLLKEPARFKRVGVLPAFLREAVAQGRRTRRGDK
jgi:N-acetylglucosaminyldiphosphoundecaprenol N-acetyl-beta-D-mannosaminyltransferase